MISLFDFSRQIAALKKDGKFSEALAFFKENKACFPIDELAKNEYVVSDVLTCLRHTKQLDAGFKFLEIYNIGIDSSQKLWILMAYGWLLWAKYKEENGSDSGTTEAALFFEEEDEDGFSPQDFSYDRNELVGRIETLISILQQVNNDFAKTLVSNLFLIVLKTEKKKVAPNWKFVDDFCNQINPALLSTACTTIEIEQKGRLQPLELASDLENWYAYKSKALMKLGNWQECLEISKEALDKLDSFHFSNDVWFSRRVALAKRHSGNIEAAIGELQRILKKKREWYIQKELAELYFEKGDLDAAFRMAVEAVNNFGPLEFKVDLIFLVGEILNEQGKSNLAFKHYSLSKLIRQSEEWKVSPKVLEALNQFEQTELPLKDLGKLKSELRAYWKGSNKTSTNEGEIVKILHDNQRGKDGFIKSNDGEVYFSVSPKWHLTKDLAVGKRVVYTVMRSIDGKKKFTKILKIIG